MQNRVAYFDNAATTFPKPEEVYTFMDEFYRNCGVNIGRGQHILAAKANSLYDETIRCGIVRSDTCKRNVRPYACRFSEH